MSVDIPSSIQITLTSISNSESITRTLVEKDVLKLGRQVKSNEEKLAQLVDANNNESEDPNAFFAASVLATNSRSDESLVKLSPIYFKSKVVSRVHAEIWLKDGQIYLKDVGSSSGTFLNKLRLSPANKRSRPYPLRQGDLIQLGVDYQGRAEAVYKAVELRVELNIDSSQRELQLKIPIRFRKALNALLCATNPYASNDVDVQQETSAKSYDCCICLAEVGPFQAIFIAPCSHCFHYKCIKGVLRECLMFPCPVCRQVANLDASVSMESLFDFKESTNDDIIMHEVNDTIRPNQFGFQQVVEEDV